MRKILFLLLLLSTFFKVSAQKKDIPVTLSYYSPYGNHFGTKVGTTFFINEWEVEKKNRTAQRKLFLSPQIGYFARPNVNQNYLINSEIGVRRSAIERKSYIALSLGMGYLLSSEIVGVSVNLGTGDYTKQREAESFLLPTINLELGSNKPKKLTFYYKLFYGRKISFTNENSGFFGLEVGARFLIRRSIDN